VQTTVVSDVIASNQRLQQQQSTTCSLPLSLDSNNNTGGSFIGDENKQKSKEGKSVKSGVKAGSSSGEKYSLRPRSLQRRLEVESSEHARISTGRGCARRGVNSGAGSAARPKQKPPPLSKYRRKTANARERDRMREINAAFETLRRAVPHIATSAHQNQHDNNCSEKLTKITTLRLAMKYIAALSQALQQSDALIQMSEARVPVLPPPSSISSSSSSSSGSLQLLSDGESLTFNEHCLTPPDLRQQSLTPPDFTRQCLNTTNLSRISSRDHSHHCGTPPLDNTRLCLSSSTDVHKTITVLSQNVLSTGLSVRAPCFASVTPDDLCESQSSADLNQHCLLTSALGQQCPNPSAANSQLCLSVPVLEPPDLSHHCLTPADFEEHTAEEQSPLLVFDDGSLDSPDLDHLLIS
jgi:bHLH factor